MKKIWKKCKFGSKLSSCIRVHGSKGKGVFIKDNFSGYVDTTY
jgi:hypothetical protein